MKISVKGRYALASMILMGKLRGNDENISIINISEELGLSKIYLEQVFSLLKRAELVTSLKGSQGGYKLAKKPENISVFNILSSIENTIFDKTESTVQGKADDIESVMREIIWGPLDDRVKEILSGITLERLINETEKYAEGLMFYI